MRTTRRGRTLAATGMGLALAVLTGCQTWFGGMTLPSGRYLDHPPQYFPPDPDFPLQRELATQEVMSGLVVPPGLPPGPGAVGPVPPPAGPAIPAPPPPPPAFMPPRQ